MPQLYRPGIESASEEFTAPVVAACAWVGIDGRMNKLRHFRDKAGLTRQALADLVDTTETTIYRKETGLRPFFWEDALKYSRYLSCLPEELMGVAPKELTHVPVVRYLRKLAITEKSTASLGGPPEMVSHAGFATGAKEATRVIGDANQPSLYEGWLVFNGEFYPGVPEELLGWPCVVEILDSEVEVIAYVHKGEGIGKYNLVPIGHKEPIMKNQMVSRTAKLLAITPA